MNQDWGCVDVKEEKGKRVLGAQMGDRTYIIHTQTFMPLTWAEKWDNKLKLIYLELRLLGVGSHWTRIAVAMSRKGSEGWLQYCSLSYNQACSCHPPFAERLLLRRKSDHDEKNLWSHTIPLFASSRLLFMLRPGSLETPFVSHLFTKEQCCLRQACQTQSPLRAIGVDLYCHEGRKSWTR